MTDKRMTEEDVVAELRDGMTIGIGGWGSRRKPMRIVRAILRSDAARTSPSSATAAPTSGCCARPARCSKVVYASARSTRSRSSRTSATPASPARSQTLELDEGMFLLGLQAAAWRVPFLPTRVGLGSDVRRPPTRAHARSTSPYDDGEELVAMPALHLDVALIHMHRGDARGNGQYLGRRPLLRRPRCCMAAPAALHERRADRRHRRAARATGRCRRCASTG